jgi:hypothetical protein
MKEEQLKTIKDTIKSIIEGHIDNQLNYEWEGSDFIERLKDELPNELGDIEITQIEGEVIEFDNELYQKFLNHTTEYIYSTLIFKQ